MIMLREEELGKFGMMPSWKSEEENKDFKEKWEEHQKSNVSQLDFEKKMMIEEAKKQEKLWEGKEIMPFGFNIMVKPSDTNPYMKKISDSGIITDNGGLFENPDSGEMDLLEREICYAVVLEVGPDVKHVRKGDEIIYRATRLMPLPFKGEGYCILNEGSVLGIINSSESLSKRFVNYGK